MDLTSQQLRQLNIRGLTPEALGVSILGDGFLACEGLEFWKDEHYQGPGWYSMRPHFRVRRYGEAYGLDEAMYITNFSRPGVTLRELGQKNHWVSG